MQVVRLCSVRRNCPLVLAPTIQNGVSFVKVLSSESPDFEQAGGLLPAIAQDVESGDVLMLAWMNSAAYEETVRTGRAVYFSRSRNQRWRKGDESGHIQEVQEIRLDCDRDTILLKVIQTGVACHTGERSCFFHQVATDIDDD